MASQSPTPHVNHDPSSQTQSLAQQAIQTPDSQPASLPIRSSATPAPPNRPRQTKKRTQASNNYTLPKKLKSEPSSPSLKSTRPSAKQKTFTNRRNEDRRATQDHSYGTSRSRPVGPAFANPSPSSYEPGQSNSASSPASSAFKFALNGPGLFATRPDQNITLVSKSKAIKIYPPMRLIAYARIQHPQTIDSQIPPTRAQEEYALNQLKFYIHDEWEIPSSTALRLTIICENTFLHGEELACSGSGITIWDALAALPGLVQGRIDPNVLEIEYSTIKNLENNGRLYILLLIYQCL